MRVQTLAVLMALQLVLAMTARPSLDQPTPGLELVYNLSTHPNDQNDRFWWLGWSCWQGSHAAPRNLLVIYHAAELPDVIPETCVNIV